ncbi:8042_t:CDS:2, partial [Scutellospora calospora]
MDLSTTSIPISSSWCTVSLGGSKNDIIFLIDGLMFDSNNKISTSLVYTFNTFDQTWSAPKISGDSPQRRKEITSFFNPSDKKIYIFGGLSDTTTGSSESLYYNDMIILDTIHLTWTMNTFSFAPTKRAGHTLTMWNEMVFMIGGKEIYTNDNKVKLVDMNEVWVYDTNSGIWSLHTAIGDKIDSRIFHTAVLDKYHRGRIIIYSGMSDNPSDLRCRNGSANPSNYGSNLLNIKNSYYFIGKSTSNTTVLNNESPVIYLFDTIGYKWVTSYFPNEPKVLLAADSSATNDPNLSDTGSNGLSMPAIIGIVTGVVFFALALLLLFFRYYQKHRIKSASPEVLIATDPIFIPLSVNNETNQQPSSPINMSQRTSSTPISSTPNRPSSLSSASSGSILKKQPRLKSLNQKVQFQGHSQVDPQNSQVNSQQLQVDSRQSLKSQQSELDSRQSQQLQVDSRQSKQSQESQVDTKRSQQSRESYQSQIEYRQSQYSQVYSQPSKVSSRKSSLQEDSRRVSFQITQVDSRQSQQLSEDPQQSQVNSRRSQQPHEYSRKSSMDSQQQQFQHIDPIYQPTIYTVPFPQMRPQIYSQLQPTYPPVHPQPIIYSHYPSGYSPGNYPIYSPGNYSPIQPNFNVIPETVENEQPIHIYTTNDGQQEGYQQYTPSNESDKKFPDPR